MNESSLRCKEEDLSSRHAVFIERQSTKLLVFVRFSEDPNVSKARQRQQRGTTYIFVTFSYSSWVLRTVHVRQGPNDSMSDLAATLTRVEGPTNHSLLGARSGQSKEK